MSTKVVQYDKVTHEKIGIYENFNQAAISINKQSAASDIRRCCERSRGSSKGYYWRYSHDTEQLIDPRSDTRVVQMDTIGNTIAVYPSASEAARKFGRKNCTQITACIKGYDTKGKNRYTAHGYKWRLLWGANR